MRPRLRVTVIGGGLQGIAAALELAGRGAKVTLLERAPAILRGASLNNEGKIHLGFVYANDLTYETARLMARGAVTFFPMLRRWLEITSCDFGLSSPFFYTVHQKSLISPDELAHRYATIAGEIRTAQQKGEGNYFDRPDCDRFCQLTQREVEQRFDTRHIQGAFATEEIAVDPVLVAETLTRRVLADPNISVVCNAEVTSVSREDNQVQFVLNGDRETSAFDHLVNCAWCGRLAIDRTAEIPPPASWSFREKCFMRLAGGGAVARMPSTTIVLGGFGDVVHYADGTIYLSWYPVARRRLVENQIQPPRLNLSRGEADTMRSEIAAALAKIVPLVGELQPQQIQTADVGCGVIFAAGTKDVDDPTSGLHKRQTAGPVSYGNYHTVDTGKYTLAPLFAKQLADTIFQSRS